MTKKTQFSEYLETSKYIDFDHPTVRQRAQELPAGEDWGMKIFLLEDDDAIAMGLTYSLEKEGYEVCHVKSAAEAAGTWIEGKFGLCILDINLPDGNGYDVCRTIKEAGDTPVIFLTAYDDEVNVVMGLEIGADDYICKPFRIKKLMARIKSVLRRAQRGDSSKAERFIQMKNLRVYPDEMKVLKVVPEKDESEATGQQWQELELTAMEYRLLLTFLNHKGKVLSRNQLLEDLWDINGDFVNDNTLTVYIKRLRDKIEDDPAEPALIKTVRGMGYVFKEF